MPQAVTVRNPTDRLIADLPHGGFITVIQNAMARDRAVQGRIDPTRRCASSEYANGRLARRRPRNGWSAELYAFGSRQQSRVRTAAGSIREREHGNFQQKQRNRCPAPSRSATVSKACTPMSASTTAPSSIRATKCWCTAPRSLAAYGEVIIEDRTATITRATWLERAVDPPDRRFRLHGTLRVFLLRGGQAMNATPMDLYPELQRRILPGPSTPPRWPPKPRC